ncbi:hypothetical protein MJ547_04285, partial [Burkholderia gladioli]
MASLRSIYAKLTRRPKDEEVELIRIHPVVPTIAPGTWSRPMIVLGATSIRGPNPTHLMRDRLAHRMLELDWEMALNEDAIREAMKDAMPADAPSRPRARL